MASDQIEREIIIEAPVDRVWSLVTEFAFGLPEGELAKHDLQEGTVFQAQYPEVGRYPLRIEKIEKARALSYRWASAFPGEEPRAGNSTLIEFTLTPTGKSTRLHVVESGFASLDARETIRNKAFDDNTSGWRKELDTLKQRAEAQLSRR